MLLRSLILFLSSAAGGVVQGTCGFGCGILAMLGYSSYLPVNQAAAVTSVINFGITFPTFLRYRKHLTVKKILLPFLIYTVSSVLIIHASVRLNAGLLKRFFGLFLLLLSLYHFTLAGRQPPRWTPLMTVLAFLVSGLGSGLFAVGGPLMVLYFLAHTDSTEEFLADTQMIFAVNALPTLTMRVRSGLLTAGHVPLLVPGLLGVLGGFWLAGRLAGRLDKPKLTRLVYLAVGVSGLLYLLGM